MPTLVPATGKLVPLTPAQRREVKRLWKKGQKVWQIAQLLKVDARLVYRVVSNMD